MTSTTLRGNTRPDLLAVPAIMLGFHPANSLVVLGLRGTRVEFVARLDQGLPRHELRSVVTQVENALGNSGCGCSALIGFGGDLQQTVLDLQNLRGLMRTEVLETLAADGERFWSVGPLGPEPQEGIPYDLTTCSLLAQSVYRGVSVRGSRAEAVAEVMPPPAHLVASLAERLDDTHATLAELGPDERLALCGRLLDDQSKVTDTQAAQLVCLLDDPDVVGAVLARLSRDTAPRIRGHLIRARQTVLGEAAGNVVGLLGIACWLAGEGAQQTECVEQLTALAPQSLLLGILRDVHGRGLSPSDWDCGGRPRPGSLAR